MTQHPAVYLLRLAIFCMTNSTVSLCTWWMTRCNLYHINTQVESANCCVWKHVEMFSLFCFMLHIVNFSIIKRSHYTKKSHLHKFLLIFNHDFDKSRYPTILKKNSLKLKVKTCIQNIQCVCVTTPWRPSHLQYHSIHHYPHLPLINSPAIPLSVAKSWPVLKCTNPEPYC